VPAAAVCFGIAPGNDTWARDHGPVTVLMGERGRGANPTHGRAVDSHALIGAPAPAAEPGLIDFRFNGWGNKFPAALDDGITAALHGAGCFGTTPMTTSPLVLEGGAIDSDGCGTLLAVRRTIEDPARNPGWTCGAIEAELTRTLGTRRVLWLEHGRLIGDDTDGHIDTLARFCDAATLCHAASRGPGDADHGALAAMARELGALRRDDGRPYRLIPLPQPRPIQGPDGERLGAGYANFLVINNAVLLPVYGDPADDIAVARLKAAFPGRTIEPIDCRLLLRQGGSLHCCTMQMPAVVPIADGIRRPDVDVVRP
jgi:agmatine/peptidylarginine deiminase